MPKVIYEMGGVAADGSVVVSDGKSDWSMPDESRRARSPATFALSAMTCAQR